MRRYILAFAVACLVMPLQAQSGFERGDFSFKITKEKNAAGEINLIKVAACVGQQTIDEFCFELDLAVPQEMADDIGQFTENDINFDGYPDFDIYLGYLGGYANNTQHEALLWDPSQHRFVQPEGYSGIGEPQIDGENKTIFTVLSVGPDQRVTTYYKWSGYRLEECLSETWAIEGADEPVDYSGVLNLPCQRFDAKIDGRIPVTIMFQKTDDDIVAGYIYYPRAKKPAPILLAGSVNHDEGTDYYNLAEYQPDGTISGYVHLEHKAVDRWDNQVEGSWYHPKTMKDMKLSNVVFSHEAAKWFTKSLLTAEDPGNIGREYSFQEWNVAYESMMGGTITFRGAGRNKLHFKCDNVSHNIATGSSSPGRPAILDGNTFEYGQVNECGYGFRAVFFPRFVVLKTTTDYESRSCFGHSASFDGVYIKVKQ